MKHKNYTGSPISVLLSALIAFCGVGCVTTAFGMNLTTAAYLTVLVALAVFALLWAAALRWRYGALLLTAVSLAVCFVLRDDLLPCIERLLYTVTERYHRGYGWGYIRWSDGALTAVSLTPALILMGYLVIVPITWVLCRRKWVGFALLAGLLPLALCCVVTDTIPAVSFLLPLLTGSLLMAMTQLTRRQDGKTAARLTALLLIPVVLFSSLLIDCARKDPHKYQAQATLNQLLDLIGCSGSSLGGPINVPGTPVEQVDLTDIGPNDPSQQEVLTVQANYNGLIYLRGRSYSAYTGTTWLCQLDTENEGGWPTDGMTEQGFLYITTKSRLSIRYFPYYVQAEKWTSKLSGGAYTNPNRKASYSFQWMQPESGTSIAYTPLSDAETEAYTELPADTRKAARQLLEELSFQAPGSTADTVQVIAEFVRSSASYDLDTQAMPDGTKDFAIWFLEESDTGYCVHFASAATVLLRAAGIPARYVSGYIAYVIPDVEVSVTGEQAHAWVEYLDPDQGWTVLEATPGAESIPDTPTAPSTQTTAPSTQTTLPPTQTTEPSTENTEPTQTVRPTLPEHTVPATETPKPSLRDTAWIGTAFWVLMAGALLFMQYGLRLRLRDRWLNQGTAKRRALRRWKYTRHMARLTRQNPPEHLLFLAEKAAFSQYELTAEELRQFDVWIRNTHEKLLQKPWPIKAILRLILAIS